MLRLVTIPISHYCEKARWALQRARIPYSEERHVQGIHRIASRRAGGHGTTPVLVTPDGSLGESEQILAWVDRRTPADQRLFPEDSQERDAVLALSRRLDDRLGPRGRRLMYVNMLAERDLMLRFNNNGVPRWENRLMRLAFPVAVRWAGRELGIRPGIEVEDEAAVWREFDFVAEHMADGRPHLCGARFTAADLTFGALAASVVVPPVYGTPLPQPGVLATTHRGSGAQGARASGGALRAVAVRPPLAFASYRRSPPLCRGYIGSRAEGAPPPGPGRRAGRWSPRPRPRPRPRRRG